MRPLVFVWPYALVFWLVLFWAFSVEFMIVQRGRRSAAAPDSKDAGSIRVIMIGQFLGMLLAFPAASLRLFRFPAVAQVPAFSVGVALLIAASLLRRHCFRVLGEYFTGDVRARADQPVIDRGAYRFVRHPVVHRRHPDVHRHRHRPRQLGQRSDPDCCSLRRVLVSSVGRGARARRGDRRALCRTS